MNKTMKLTHIEKQQFRLKLKKEGFSAIEVEKKLKETLTPKIMEEEKIPVEDLVPTSDVPEETPTEAPTAAVEE